MAVKLLRERVAGQAGGCGECVWEHRYTMSYEQAVTAPPPPPGRHGPARRRYAADQHVFFAEYAAAHQKLSELGVAWPGAQAARPAAQPKKPSAMCCSVQ